MSNGVVAPVPTEVVCEKVKYSEPDSLGSSDTDTESDNEQEPDSDADPERTEVPSSHPPELESAKGEGLQKQPQQEIRRIPAQPRTDGDLHIHHIMWALHVWGLCMRRQPGLQPKVF